MDSSTLSMEEARELCAGIVLHGTNASYDPNSYDANRVFNVEPHMPDGLDCQLVMNVSAPEQQPLYVQLTMTFIFMLLTIIGVVGNILVITVVLRVRGMITPTNCYLVSLAISDTLFFLATTQVEVGSLYTNNYLFGAAGCRAFTFLSYLAINLSSLSITAFTIERYFGICKPYRARQMCTVERAKLILKIIWVFAIVYNSTWLFLVKIEEEDGETACTFSLERSSILYKVIYVSDITLFYALPMLLNIFIYIKIYLVLMTCGDKLKHTAVNLIGAKSSSQDGENGNVHANHTNGHNAHPSETKAAEYQIRGGMGRGGSTKGKNSVVKMLAVVVFVFATCWLPYRGLVMRNSFAKTPWYPDWFIFFCKTLIFINCAINPILYNLMSVRFRNAFRSLLSGKRTGRSFSPTMTNCTMVPKTCTTLTVVDNRGRTTTAPSNNNSRDELKALVSESP